MLVSKKKYNKLLAEYLALQEQHTELCNKSQELVNRHINLRNTIILHFGNDLFTTDVQSNIDKVTKTGNVIQVNKWKK